VRELFSVRWHDPLMAAKTAKRIADEAPKLPVEAHATLAGTLLESLDQDADEEAEAAWSADIARRVRDRRGRRRCGSSGWPRIPAERTGSSACVAYDLGRNIAETAGEVLLSQMAAVATAR
jgi:hypothetical protein